MSGPLAMAARTYDDMINMDNKLNQHFTKQSMFGQSFTMEIPRYGDFSSTSCQIPPDILKLKRTKYCKNGFEWISMEYEEYINDSLVRSIYLRGRWYHDGAVGRVGLQYEDSRAALIRREQLSIIIKVWMIRDVLMPDIWTRIWQIVKDAVQK